MVLAGLASLSFTQGCSSSDADGASERSIRMMETLATAFCATLRDCCDAASHPYDEASCVQTFRANQPFVDDASYANTFYDEGQVQKCAEAIQAQEADCSAQTKVFDRNSYYDGELYRACRHVIQGELAPGAPCEDLVQCAAPASNVFASCYDRNDPVHEQDKRCHRITANLMLGEHCNANFDSDPYEFEACAGLAFCDAATSTCKPQRQLLEPCSADQECESGRCDEGTCRGPEPLRREGEPCEGGNPYGSCVEGFNCTLPASCLNDPSCVPKTVCTRARPAGSTCSEHTDCDDGGCFADSSPEASTPMACVGDENMFLVSARTCAHGPSHVKQPVAP